MSEKKGSTEIGPLVLHVMVMHGNGDKLEADMSDVELTQFSLLK